MSIVAGASSFGTATAAMMAGKAGVRKAIKAPGKVVLSAAKKQGAELAAKSAKVFKNIGPKIVDFTQGLACKLLKAFFPAGTPIAVKGGYKNIEDIEVGDLVWSWDEATGDIGLKPVTAVMEKTAEALIEITSGSETIRATPKNPFWVGEAETGSWKNADELTEDDELWLLDKRNKSILSLDLQPQEKPIVVYNFEVAEWHTYFVGIWMMLVHNACHIKVFFDAYPHLKGFVAQVHHAIPQDVFKKWPTLFDKKIKHSLDNLRGIPAEGASKLHQGEIHTLWNDFYEIYREAKVTPTKEAVEGMVKQIDELFGHRFNPPI